MTLTAIDFTQSGPLTGKPRYQQKVYSPVFGIACAAQTKLAAWLSVLPRPLVFTNGCFDLLHRGHISYLQSAAQLGASLVVGLNSDSSVKRLGKDPGRPINTLDDRMALVAALASVDAVVAFDADTPLELIMAVKPEILVKGGDWPVEKIVGGEEVTSWGGAVHSIEFEFPHSTTALIGRIRQRL